MELLTTPEQKFGKLLTDMFDYLFGVTEINSLKSAKEAALKGSNILTANTLIDQINEKIDALPNVDAMRKLRDEIVLHRLQPLAPLVNPHEGRVFNYVLDQGITNPVNAAQTLTNDILISQQENIPHNLQEPGLSQEQIIYKELFLKFKSERDSKQNAYLITNDLLNQFNNGGIGSGAHPDYFKIDNEWQEKRAHIDGPMLEQAKYKIGDTLEFIRRHTKVLSRGVITKVHTADDGSGELIYCFDTLVPPVMENNPYCMESDVVKVLNRR